MMAIDILTVAKPNETKPKKPKKPKPADVSSTGADMLLNIIYLLGFFLVLYIIVCMESYCTQQNIESANERREYVEQQNIRRKYDPTRKEMKEDIRSIAKRTHPNNYKEQVIFERNMKDLYGLD